MAETFTFRVWQPGIHLWVCFQILKRFSFQSPRNWYCEVFQVSYANNSQLIWNVKSHFQEFLQAKMACVSKLLQAKVWFLLANLQLTTVSVEPCMHMPNCNKFSVYSNVPILAWNANLVVSATYTGYMYTFTLHSCFSVKNMKMWKYFHGVSKVDDKN